MGFRLSKVKNSWAKEVIAEDFGSFLLQMVMEQIEIERMS